ncbi:MAG TPA: hypothetical protein DDW21_08565 [Verrucomicrobiales bacterium]|nr:hypothetical protein [Verrucomicrobiales bacterium]
MQVLNPIAVIGPKLRSNKPSVMPRRKISIIIENAHQRSKLMPESMLNKITRLPGSAQPRQRA